MTGPANELINLSKHGEFYLVQFAHFGEVSESFWEHASSRVKHLTEKSWLDYLAGRSQEMLAEYGALQARGPMSIIPPEALHA